MAKAKKKKVSAVKKPVKAAAKKKVVKKAVKKAVKKTVKKAVKKTVKKPAAKAAKKGAKKAVKKTVKKTAAKRKSKKVSALPKGYNHVTPYLIVNNAMEAIAFYKKVFDAKEVLRMENGGKVGHAELKLGDSKIMLADVCSEMGTLSPDSFGGTPVSIHLYVKNVDAVIEGALMHGAKLLRPVTDMFYGDRSGGIEDPYGHKWCVATHIEDVTPAQVRKRSAEVFNK